MGSAEKGRIVSFEFVIIVMLPVIGVHCHTRHFEPKIFPGGSVTKRHFFQRLSVFLGNQTRLYIESSPFRIFRCARDNIKNAAMGVRSVEGRRGAQHYLDLVHIFEGDRDNIIGDKPEGRNIGHPSIRKGQ